MLRVPAGINFVFVLKVHLSESCTCFSHLRDPVAVLQLPLLSLHTSEELYCIFDPNPARTRGLLSDWFST